MTALSRNDCDMRSSIVGSGEEKMADSEASSSSSVDVEELPEYSGPITRGRSKGRVARRGRSRGRSQTRGVQSGRVGKKSKGKGKQLSTSDVDRIKELQSERIKLAEELIDQLEGEEAIGLLKEVVKKQPSLVLEVAELIKRRSMGEPPSPPSVPDAQRPAWCVCGMCRQMSTDAEKLCCGMAATHCMSKRPEMQLVIMDPLVLHIQQVYRRDLFALHAVEETDLNKGNRHAAYRQYVLWQFGRLTEGDRRVIPSCVVLKIRDRFPDANNTYVGFVPGRLF